MKKSEKDHKGRGMAKSILAPGLSLCLIASGLLLGACQVTGRGAGGDGAIIMRMPPMPSGGMVADLLSSRREYLRVWQGRQGKEAPRKEYRFRFSLPLEIGRDERKVPESIALWVKVEESVGTEGKLLLDRHGKVWRASSSDADWGGLTFGEKIAAELALATSAGTAMGACKPVYHVPPYENPFADLAETRKADLPEHLQGEQPPIRKRTELKFEFNTLKGATLEAGAVVTGFSLSFTHPVTITLAGIGQVHATGNPK
jgi:hypothetical protein